MSKHMLDGEVEEILQHYGIKGMKWGVRRTDQQLAEAEGGGGGGGDEEEEDESLLDEISDTVSDVFDAVGEKLEDVGDTIKKKGKSLLVNIFGKGGDGKWKKAKPSDSKYAKDLKKEMVKYNKASPAEKRLMKKGYKVDTTTSIQKKPNKVTAADKAKAQRKARSTPEAKQKQHEFKKKLYKSDQKAARTKASDKRATN